MSKFKCVMQHDMTDCAAACLAMICLYYNKDMTITRLRDICIDHKMVTGTVVLTTK